MTTMLILSLYAHVIVPLVSLSYPPPPPPGSGEKGDIVPRVYNAMYLAAMTIGHTIVIALFLFLQAFCFVAMFLFGFLGVWSLIFMVKEWNDKVVKYTIKEAITG